MIAADHRLYEAAKAHAAATLALVDNLRAGRGSQWEAPPGASLRIEHDFHADYTGETAVDPTRLRVRAAVENGLATLEHATHELTRVSGSLEESLRPYVTRHVAQAPITR